MKKYLFIPSLLISLVLASGIVYAQKGSGSNSGSGSGQETQSSTSNTGSGNQVQNQNQVATQNQGEDSQLKVTTQHQESSQFTQVEISNNKGAGNRSVTARQHMSAVATAVEEILATTDKTEGIGKQVNIVAKQQQKAQQQLKSALNDIEGKKGLSKKLFGPNYSALKETKRLMQQNQVRIQQLIELKNQVQTQGEQSQLQEMIQSMIVQNTTLQDQVQAEENVKSLFGWLVRRFN